MNKQFIMQSFFVVVVVAPVRFNLVIITSRHYLNHLLTVKCVYWKSSHSCLISIVIISSLSLYLSPICLIIPNSSGKYFTFINLSALVISVMCIITFQTRVYSSPTFFTTSLNFHHNPETSGQIPDPEAKSLRWTRTENQLFFFFFCWKSEFLQDSIHRILIRSERWNRSE